jgi:hypothetical protein
MGFFITEEKELPEFSNQDANKVLKVDSSGVYLQWLQETTTPAELPSQAGNQGRFLTTDGSVPSWAVVNQIPGATAGVSGYLLTNNGSSASWTNGPIGLATGATATPMLWFGASNNGFAEAWTAGGGATGVSAITNGAVCCTFQSGAIRLPGGNPIRSNGNAASRFQFTQDVPNMQNSVTAGTVGTDRSVSVVSTNWSSTSLDLVSSYTQDNPGNLVASSMAVEIKNNQILFTGAGTNTSGTTLPARQTRMTIDNSLITTNTCLSVTSGLALTFSSQASNRTMTQNDNTFQRMNFSSNDVTYTLPVLNNGTMFYFNPFANAGSTFGAYLQGGTGGTGGVQNFEIYFNGVRTQISNAGQTGTPSTPAKITLEAGSIYQCIYMASLGNWHIIRLGITQQVNFTGGSALVPSISFNDPPGVTGNTASGLYGADNSVSISTNGTERFTVTNNGVASQSRFISTRGLAITNGYSFNGTDIAGLYASSSDSTMHLVSNTVPVLSVLNVGGAGGTGGTNTTTINGTLNVTGVRCPFVSRNHTSIPIGATTNMMIRALISDNVPSTLDLPNLGATLTGQTHVIIPYKDAASTGTLAMWTGGTTGHAIHVMHNSTKTVVTGSSSYPLIEGGVYTCVWHHITTTAGQLQGIWYVWIDGLSTNTVSDPFVVASTIDFFSSGSAIARILGDNAGVNSSMSMIINGTTNIKYTVDNTEVQNSLRLFKAPITDWIIVDSSTHNVSRNSPSKIILTKGTTGSSSATVVFPTSDSAPDGLTIQVMVWMLPDRTGTGTQRVRFDSASPTNNAFVLGSSGTGIALGGTTYTVTEGTVFTATNFRTTIGRWMVDSTRFNSTPALTAA